MLGPQLGLGDGDGLVARHRRVGQPLQRAVAERVPGAQRLRRGRVDAQVGVRRVRRQVPADAGVVGQGDPEERRSLPQGRDGHGLPRVAGQPVAADDDARAVLERWRAEAVPRRPQPDAAGPGLPLGRDDVAGERPQPLAGLVEGGRQRLERGRQPADPFAASSAWYLAVAVSTALRLLSASSGRAGAGPSLGVDGRVRAGPGSGGRRGGRTARSCATWRPGRPSRGPAGGTRRSHRWTASRGARSARRRRRACRWCRGRVSLTKSMHSRTVVPSPTAICGKAAVCWK